VREEGGGGREKRDREERGAEERERERERENVDSTYVNQNPVFVWSRGIERVRIMCAS